MIERQETGNTKQATRNTEIGKHMGVEWGIIRGTDRTKGTRRKTERETRFLRFLRRKRKNKVKAKGFSRAFKNARKR